MHSSKDRQSNIHLYKVLGSSRKKLQEDMKRKSYKELFFYREIREVPLMRLFLSTVLNEVK